jgi:hypothetical protein
MGRCAKPHCGFNPGALSSLNLSVGLSACVRVALPAEKTQPALPVLGFTLFHPTDASPHFLI